MSHSNFPLRMATSIAVALTTAAITACGGGASDTQSTSDSTSAVVSDASASAAETSTTGANASVAGGLTTSTSPDSSSAGDSTTSTGSSVSSVASSGSSGVASSGSSGDAATPPPDAGATAEAPAATGAQVQVATASAETPLMARPAGNTGTGFFVVGAKLYDAKGSEFRIRGVNRTHWDSWGSPTGIPLSGANAERIHFAFTNPASDLKVVTSQMLPNKIVPIPGNWGGTCKADAASLTSVVDTWVAQAATWTTLNSNGLINIANEWGPANSTVWRDGYVTAIARMRAAGYTGTLVVDSGGCGQDAQDVISYGAAVLASDPQKNILFDVHVYGNFALPATTSWQQDFTTSMAKLKATGLPMIIGEFGPGNNIGPSPTMITPMQVVTMAETNGWGWMPWSWDDNNLVSCGSDDKWFSMTKRCGNYATSADLTAFGLTIVPILQAKATKATTF